MGQLTGGNRLAALKTLLPGGSEQLSAKEIFQKIFAYKNLKIVES
jgi:hypothetical protein